MIKESLLIPYQAAPLPDASVILVLAPHPDDEVFGCGGGMALHVASGGAVHVVLVTAGDSGGDSTMRLAESAGAARILGYPAPECWGLPDRGVEYGEYLVQRIMEKISTSNATLLYAPSLWENHPDHRAVALAALEALRRHGQCGLMAYEVSAPLRPNRLIDITSVFGKKQEAAACFPSQLAKQRYDRQIFGLEAFRTYTLPPEVLSAEGYEYYPAEELCRGAVHFLQSEYQRQHAEGLIFLPGNSPLVSVMIRSMDRPELDDALNSVAAQTWPHVEVVVVNAKGVGHRRLPAWCGRFPLSFVDSKEPVPRSRAANVAIEHASGKYLLFLDDDDVVDPDHLAFLVATLEAADETVVAYSGVRGLHRGDQKQNEEIVFADPEASFAKLLLRNVIPIHAPLFPACLLETGARFDEGFHVYEDWDFWLQLARKAPFVFTGHVSATYFMGGSSGVCPFGSSSTTQADATFALYAKWMGIIGPQELLGISALFRTSERGCIGLARDIEERNSMISERDRQLYDFACEVAARKAEIDELYRSKSWRFTAPLRWFNQKLRGK